MSDLGDIINDLISFEYRYGSDITREFSDSWPTVHIEEGVCIKRVTYNSDAFLTADEAYEHVNQKAAELNCFTMEPNLFFHEDYFFYNLVGYVKVPTKTLFDDYFRI